MQHCAVSCSVQACDGFSSADRAIYEKPVIKYTLVDDDAYICEDVFKIERRLEHAFSTSEEDVWSCFYGYLISNRSKIMNQLVILKNSVEKNLIIRISTDDIKIGARTSKQNFLLDCNQLLAIRFALESTYGLENLFGLIGLWRRFSIESYSSISTGHGFRFRQYREFNVSTNRHCPNGMKNVDFYCSKDELHSYIQGESFTWHEIKGITFFRYHNIDNIIMFIWKNIKSPNKFPQDISSSKFNTNK